MSRAESAPQGESPGSLAHNQSRPLSVDSLETEATVVEATKDMEASSLAPLASEAAHRLLSPLSHTSINPTAASDSSAIINSADPRVTTALHNSQGSHDVVNGGVEQEQESGKILGHPWCNRNMFCFWLRSHC